LKVQFFSAISEIPPSRWDGLFDGDYPFIRHAFLAALEASGCVSADTGWQPRHMLLTDGDEPVAAMPLYLKSHSYGEFVFDWGWAEAYSRHGLEYYPKLLTAIPFSPVAGPRIGICNGADKAAIISTVLAEIRVCAGKQDLSGWHLLFPDTQLSAAIGEASGLLHRRAVQFRWFNRDFSSFDDYLACMRSSRRKNVRRERRHVAESGVTLQRKSGSEIDAVDRAAFYQCYRATYQKRSGHDGYLSRDFFEMLFESMGEQMMLVVVQRADVTIACSLFLFDRQNLYGRYWGALEDIRCLHFEACLYQGIEFCIERGLSEFDPGTQGEHKLMRGFEPFLSSSWHWIADKRFRAAIRDFLQHEDKSNSIYKEKASDFLPYRKEP
jgi:predicted N-acyltransferase